MSVAAVELEMMGLGDTEVDRVSCVGKVVDIDDVGGESSLLPILLLGCTLVVR